VGRNRLNGAAALTALLAASALALSACSSSGSSGGNTSAPPTTQTSSSSSSSSTGASGISCTTGTLNGSGSTAQTNAMDAWRKAYQEACSGAKINYDSIGSGDGISAFTDKKADFAGSDAALDPKAEMPPATKACGSPAIDLPMVVGPVAIAYNLSGVNNLTLNASTIAQIYSGKIKTWNDPAIAALNKGVNLPSTAIKPFYRSDDSGTTYNFESYLAAAAPKDFTSTPSKTSSDAHFAGQGQTGSQGVADAVTQTAGGIGYMEYSYAVKAQLPYAAIDSGSGPVQLSKDTASKAVATAKIVGTGNDLSLSIDYGQNTPGAYPLVLVTYEIVCTKYKDAATGTFVKDFLNYTAGSGQTILPGLGYAPIPASLATKVKASIAKIS
jgi:phosphate transport system substrate-binding protein